MPHTCALDRVVFYPTKKYALMSKKDAHACTKLTLGGVYTPRKNF